jgi:hypothetical protein
MIFSLDVIPALKGDCLILHYGSKDDPHMVLIDGGPSGVYDSLRQRFEQIREARELEDQQPLFVDLLMVSHVDDDHIRGILDLTKELKEAADNQQPPLVKLLGVWHNSFENIIEEKPAPLPAAFDGFGTASLDGDPPEGLTDYVDDDDAEAVRSSLKVLQSIKQGAQLRKNLDGLGLGSSINVFFQDKKQLVVAEGQNSLPMGNGLSFTVVGPMDAEVEALRQKHQQWLKDLAKEGKKPEDVLAAYVDKSVTNLSSIVVLAKVGDNTMLLTGDALGKKILDGLELVGLVLKGGTLEVDIFKVPHHGSSNNLAEDFFQRIIAKDYVFSGNGEHGNPERESLEMLWAARGDADYKVHLTYSVEEIDDAREAEWKKQQAKEKKRQLEKPEKKIRPDWSPATQTITAFLEDNKSFSNKIHTVPEDEPYLIDLLEKVDT